MSATAPTPPAAAKPAKAKSSQSWVFYAWVGVVLAVAVIAVVLGWHSSGGTPDPSNPATHRMSNTTAVINSAVLVFREGLETILVLAAITASFLGGNKVYRRPVAVGGGVAILATIATWFAAVGIIDLLGGSGLTLQFLRLPPFIVTLGTMTSVRGLARLFGHDNTIFNSSLPFAFLGNGNVLGVPWLVIIALATVVISWLILRRTVLGLRIYAIGGNAEASRLAGIKVWAITLFVYTISGLLAGLGGALSAARLYAANGMQLGFSYELDAIAAVILGGTSFVGGIGSIWGTLIGALIIAVLSNGLILIGVSDTSQFVIKGLVIIGAVALDHLRGSASART